MSDDLDEFSFELPATSAFVIEPADVDLPRVTRAVHANAGGLIRAVFADSAALVEIEVRAGAVYAYRLRRILPGTTARVVGLL